MSKRMNISKPKKKRKIWKRIGLWFLVMIALAFIAVTFFQRDAEGNVITPDWYSNIVVFVPITIAVFYDKIKWRAAVEKFEKAFRKNAEEASRVKAADFVPPRTKSAQKAVSEELSKRIESGISLAKNSHNVLAFVGFCNEVSTDFSKLEKLDKIKPDVSLALSYGRFKDEFQLHLCNTIVRQKSEVIADIKGKYKNSREFQRKALEDFEQNLNLLRSKFSVGTAQLADESCDEIRGILGIRRSQDNQNVSMHQQFSEYGGVNAELLSVDLMEGHEFESWCADLLKKNGFTNVEVTPGSGDQGVDIVATKDDVKFAIQCKRYNSDLGNTPVQEVTAGRKYYHCQVGVVMTNRHFTTGAKELAKTTGTLLWDRERLQEFIQTADRP